LEIRKNSFKIQKRFPTSDSSLDSTGDDDVDLLPEHECEKEFEATLIEFKVFLENYKVSDIVFLREKVIAKR
jgi:hypothetical protein